MPLAPHGPTVLRNMHKKLSTHAGQHVYLAREKTSWKAETVSLMTPLDLISFRRIHVADMTLILYRERPLRYYDEDLTTTPPRADILLKVE